MIRLNIFKYGFVDVVQILVTHIMCFLQIAGRLVVGFAVSLSAIAECVYISEIAPPVSNIY